MSLVAFMIGVLCGAVALAVLCVAVGVSVGGYQPIPGPSAVQPPPRHP